jgi:hypothetical protein
MRRITHAVPLAGALVATAAVWGADVAFSAIPDANGVIHACVHRANGNVRIVEQESSCRPPEEAISWPRQGPPAPATSGIVARIREAGPVTFPGDAPVAFPLVGNTWSQGPDEHQEIVGRITWNRCLNSGMYVDVFLDGVQRLRVVATQPVPRPRGPAPPVEFRIMSFEPGVAVDHQLEITVTEFACYEGPSGTVNTATIDVLSWK